MTEPTPEQRRTCYEIECFRGVYGRGPSEYELARLLGCSRSAVQKRLHYMAKKGLVTGGCSGRGRRAQLDTHCPLADMPGNR